MNDKIKVMVNGLNGRSNDLPAEMARKILEDSRFMLLPFSLTAPATAGKYARVGACTVNLISHENRVDEVEQLKAAHPGFITVDFQTTADDCLGLYCVLQLPFIMQATGEFRQRVMAIVARSRTAAMVVSTMDQALFSVLFLAEKLRRGIRPEEKRVFTLTDALT